MPTEKIADQVTGGFHAEVSWRRKPGLDLDDQGTSPGHVQIATVNVHSPFEFPEVEHGTSWEAGEKFDGWRVTLDEAGIDRLIKALHRAKNQAFGGGDIQLTPGPEVTVESDATAAARLDVDRYRAVRRGGR